MREQKEGTAMKNLWNKETTCPLFCYADRYIKKSSWKDLALIKFCLFSIGILVGIGIPKKNRKFAGIIAAAVFAVTYIPLMVKFIAVVRENGK